MDGKRVTPLLLNAGDRILVQRDSVGIFPANAGTARCRRETATLTCPPERYQPSMGKRKRWAIRTDLGDLTVNDGGKLIKI